MLFLNRNTVHTGKFFQIQNQTGIEVSNEKLCHTGIIRYHTNSGL